MSRAWNNSRFRSMASRCSIANLQPTIANVAPMQAPRVPTSSIDIWMRSGTGQASDQGAGDGPTEDDQHVGHELVDHLHHGSSMRARHR